MRWQQHRDRVRKKPDHLPESREDHSRSKVEGHFGHVGWQDEMRKPTGYLHMPKRTASGSNRSSFQVLKIRLDNHEDPWVRVLPAAKFTRV